MVNYTNSKVYKIWSTQGNKIYIGSTTKYYLSQRMDKHRTDYRRWKDKRSNFITSFTYQYFAGWFGLGKDFLINSRISSFEVCKSSRRKYIMWPLL